MGLCQTEERKKSRLFVEKSSWLVFHDCDRFAFSFCFVLFAKSFFFILMKCSQQSHSERINRSYANSGVSALNSNGDFVCIFVSIVKRKKRKNRRLNEKLKINSNQTLDNCDALVLTAQKCVPFNHFILITSTHTHTLDQKFGVFIRL